MNRKALFCTRAAVIAALYAALTLLLWQFSSLGIQVRVSEALCILPFFTSAAIPGLTVGCLIGNLLGGNPFDIIGGTLATLLAAILTAAIGKLPFRSAWVKRILLPLPAVLCNTVIIPFVLLYGYGIAGFGGIGGIGAILLLALSVFAGQVIACYFLGIPLLLFLEKHRSIFG